MPGIIGTVSRIPLIESDCCKQFIKSTPSAVKIISDEGVQFHVVPPSHGPKRFSATKEGAVSILIYGHCFHRSGIQYYANNILYEYKKINLDFLRDLEGAFHIVILDGNRRQLMVINDRLGTLPLYWSQDAEKIIFSQKIQYMKNFSWQDLDEIGFLTFLVAGYCYHDRTLFKDVRYLTPASILTVDLDTLRTTQTRYWNLVYRLPPKRLNTRDLCDQLNDTIMTSVSLFTPEESHTHAGIFLSGGWDSKGILGALLRQKHPPACVVANGENDHFPYSDTFIARQIARKENIPYRLNQKNPYVSELVIQDGINNCELITDSSPEVFGQHRIAPSVLQNLDFIFKGDEIWGWQDYAFNREQAIGHVMPNQISPALKQMLSPSLAASAADIYLDEINRIWAGCENEQWNDQKDYLYLYGRVNRYIFGVGDSDEQHIEVRRPFLTSAVLNVISNIPSELRIQKNLFKQMLIRHYPRLVAFGDAYTSSIPDYYFHMRDLIVRQTTCAFEEGFDFGGCLNPEAALSLIQAFSPVLTSRKVPPLKTRLQKKIEDRWMFHYHRSSLYQKKEASQWEYKITSNDRIVFRLWLLCSLFLNHRNNTDV